MKLGRVRSTSIFDSMTDIWRAVKTKMAADWKMSSLIVNRSRVGLTYIHTSASFGLVPSHVAGKRGSTMSDCVMSSKSKELSNVCSNDLDAYTHTDGQAHE